MHNDHKGALDLFCMLSRSDYNSDMQVSLFFHR